MVSHLSATFAFGAGDALASLAAEPSTKTGVLASAFAADPAVTTAKAATDAAHALHLPEVVLLFSILLLIASLAAVGLKRLHLPYTAALVLLGVALRQISLMPGFEALSSLRLSADLTIFVLVPALLFEAAFNIDSRRLFDNLWPILVLAVPVLLISTTVVALFLAGFGGLTLPVALVFGALISATDPVAVLAIFKEIGAPKRLSMLVDGESLFNDGTSLVFFKLLLGLALAGAGGIGIVPSATVEFIRVALGGTLVGLGTAWLCAQMLGRINREGVVELSLSLVLAYATFSLAEHVFHVSGVIATVVAGVTLGNYGRTKISPAVLPQMEHFWEYLGFVANALIFLLVGLSVDLGSIVALGPMLGLTLLAVLVGRALPIFALLPLTNRFIRYPIPRSYQVVLFWGGLRGALALAMALSLPAEFEARQLFIDLTFGVVLFTLLVGGPSTGLVLRRLGLMRDSREQTIERQTALALVAKEVEDKVAKLRGEGILSVGVVDELAAHLHAQREELQAQLEASRVSEHFTVQDEQRLLERHALILERQIATHLYNEGDISESTLKDLHHQCQALLDALRWEEEEAHGLAAPHASPLAMTIHSWFDQLTRALTAWRVGEWARVHLVEREFERLRARRLTMDAVLLELGEMEEAHISDEVVTTLEERYRAKRQAVDQALADLTLQEPRLVEQTQRIIARRFYLRTEHAALEHLYHAGLISERVVRDAEEEIEAELVLLRRQHAVASTSVALNV
jgi:monovalent cation:H+ antiporter, CPA1 family